MLINQLKQIMPETIKQQVGVLRNVPKTLKTVYLKKTASINFLPIIILGHQKSGTSAIAALLSEATDKSVTIDIVPRKNGIAPYLREDLFKTDFLLSNFIQKNAYYFSTDIIKEPDLTFHYEGLLNYFPKAKFIYVIRDPRHTIRSILNRLKIPGNLQVLDDTYKQDLRHLKLWELMIEGNFPHVSGKNYIEKLAHRWNLAAEVYLQYKNNMQMVRYEDFAKDKIGVINRLARQVELEPIHDISNKLNVQYQPRGNHKVSLIEFFGVENLNQIESICGDKMGYFGYQPSK